MRLQLIEHFQSVSAVNSEAAGHITRQQWADGLREVLKLPGVPFRQLAGMLGLPKYGTDGTRGGPLCYTTFLARFEAKPFEFEELHGQPGIVTDSVKRLAQVLNAHHYHLRTLFLYFDFNCNGYISRAEFRNGMHALAEILPELKQFTEEQILALMDYFDRDKNDIINFSELTEGFKVRIRNKSRGVSMCFCPGLCLPKCLF